MKCPYCIKVCSKCGRLLVANEMNFRKSKGGKYNLRGECRECEKKYKEQYYRDNKDKEKERVNQYYKDNPHVVFNNHIKQRHGLDSNITKEQYYEVLEYFGYKCAYCGCELNENNLTLDHVIPLSKGGAVDPWCVIPSCRSCNSSKHASEMLLWLSTKEMIDIEELEKIEKIYSWCEFAFDKYNDN